MHIGNSVSEIKTEIFWGGGRKETGRRHTLEKYLRSATAQHYYSWRNGVPTGELLTSLVYLFSKWQCQCVQLCVVCVCVCVCGHAAPGLPCAYMHETHKYSAAYRADVLYQTYPKLGSKCERAGRNSLTSLSEVGLSPGRFQGNCQ
jgi:hypothetical protein